MSEATSRPATADDTHRAALDDGRLTFQACTCGHAWLPPRDACPACLSPAWSWREACGRGRLVSWVVYRVAYDDAFKDNLPYNVAIVELDEGPRLISNITDGPDGRGFVIDMPLQLIIVREGAVTLARFARIEPAHAS